MPLAVEAHTIWQAHGLQPVLQPRIANPLSNHLIKTKLLKGHLYVLTCCPVGIFGRANVLLGD